MIGFVISQTVELNPWAFVDRRNSKLLKPVSNHDVVVPKCPIGGRPGIPNKQLCNVGTPEDTRSGYKGKSWARIIGTCIESTARSRFKIREKFSKIPHRRQVGPNHIVVGLSFHAVLQCKQCLPINRLISLDSWKRQCVSVKRMGLKPKQRTELNENAINGGVGMHVAFPYLPMFKVYWIGVARNHKH